jgi:hypothetical protein
MMILNGEGGDGESGGGERKCLLRQTRLLAWERDGERKKEWSKERK